MDSILEETEEEEEEEAMMQKIDRETDREANERSKRESLSESELTLYLDGTASDKLIEQLALYRYIDNVADVHVGKYVRWINRSDASSKAKEDVQVEEGRARPSSVLTMGGVVTRVHAPFTKNQNSGASEWIISLYNKYTRSNIQIKYKDVLVYQKLTDMEQLIVAIRSQKSK